jgi:hypothetical protein
VASETQHARKDCIAASYFIRTMKNQNTVAVHAVEARKVVDRSVWWHVNKSFTSGLKTTQRYFET